MNFFKKLFGQDNNAKQPTETLLQNQPPCKSEQELLEYFGGNAFEKQFDLDEVIGDSNWNIDLNKEQISFGGSLVFSIQILGTFSYSSETWLWAWSNDKSELSENVIQQALQLKKYGEKNNINLLKNSRFNATENDLHLIGLIASGMFNASCYYVANYGDGAVVITIKSNTIDKVNAENNHHQRILTVFPQLIPIFEMDHNATLTNYLIAKGYHVSKDSTGEDSKLTAIKNGSQITAKFDSQSRLISLNG